MLRLSQAAVAALVLGALPAAAVHAEPTRLVREPAGWRSDPEQASALAQRLAASGTLGGLPAVTAAEAFVAAQPGAALFVSRATAALPDGADTAARALRLAIDELRASPARGALAGGAARERSWDEAIDGDGRQVAARQTWDDPTTGARAVARLVAVTDGARLAMVTGECLAGEAAPAGALAACEAALATLDPGIPQAGRVALRPSAPSPVGSAGASSSSSGVPSSSSSSGAPTGASAPSSSGASASATPRMSEPARLTDGGRVSFPPMTISPAPVEPDRRPMYVGLGVCVLAAGLWWSRRQRDRFEREHGEPPDPRGRLRRRARAAERDTDGDSDADALRAAALGASAEPASDAPSPARDAAAAAPPSPPPSEAPPGTAGPHRSAHD